MWQSLVKFGQGTSKIRRQDKTEWPAASIAGGWVASTTVQI